MSRYRLEFSLGRTIITLLLVAIVVVSGTFAWLTYSSKQSALVLTIGDVNNSKVIINPYEIRESLLPVNVYTSGVYSQVQAINNSSNEMTIKLFYKINQLGDDIINNGLKYTIVSSSTVDGAYNELVTGDFTTIGTQSEYVIYEGIVDSNTTLYYRVYLWIDSSVGNQSTIQEMGLDVELNANVTIIECLSPLESYSCANGSAGGSPYLFTYTGNCTVIDDGDGNWRIKFLTSGTLTLQENISVDTFLVGGGGGGGKAEATTSSHKYGGGGGGGGYTVTGAANLIAGTSYEIVIGEGGTSETDGVATVAFNLTANGGLASTNASGGTGGSGGGGGGEGSTPDGGTGGSDGGTGTSGYGSAGTGQGTTTREFGEETGDLYAGGGGGGAGYKFEDGTTAPVTSGRGTGGSGGGGNGGKNGIGGSGVANTGGGGGGGSGDGGGGTGGSGIVVIRNAR